MRTHLCRRSRMGARAIVAVVAASMLVAAVGAAPASAERFKPNDPVESPVALPFAWNIKPICGTPSLELAKALNGLLGIQLYVVDKPRKGESGFLDHDLVRVGLEWFVAWAKANDIDISTSAKADAAIAVALQSDAFKTELKARTQKRLDDRGGRLDPTQTSGANGRFQVWCLDKTDDHAPIIGAFFVPRGGAPFWVGACTFASGINIAGYAMNLATRDLTKTFWVNSPPPDSNVDQYIHVYTYDDRHGSLTIERIWGRWTNGPPWKFTPSNDKSKNLIQVFYPAPNEFKGLLITDAQCSCDGSWSSTLASLDAAPDDTPLLAELCPAATPDGGDQPTVPAAPAT